MKRRTKLLALSCLLTFGSVSGQDNDSLFSRMQAISNSGIDFFNVDGFEITTQKVAADFTPKSISRKFKNLSVKEKEITSSDSTLGFSNFYVSKSKEESAGITVNMSYYFFLDTDNKVAGISFVAMNKKDRELEKKFVKLVKNNSIPQYVYTSLQIDSINFAGRKIPLGSSCRWMGINNVQCPYFGQMNWSVHQTLEDANLSVDNQFKSIKAKRNGKIVADTLVDVIFEGAEVKAKRVVYDFTGVASALVGMSGGKTLTIYFVSAPVRNNFVSCVMSFWNNDQINPGGLSPLLEQVMKLK